MNVLALTLQEQSSNSKSGIGIKIAPAAPRIPCLFFADDSLLFCRTTSQACHKLKAILDTFCAQSGQLINFHKSRIVFSKNTCTFDKNVVCGIFNVPHTDSIGTYLGCPMSHGRPHPDLFQKVVVKSTAKLNSWKARCFSKADRVVLIQSNLETLPTHVMQCYKLPTRVTTQLDRINREFFWKNSNSDKGLPLIAWDKICRPKALGGLGLRKSAAVNTAYLAKLGWKFLTQPENYWVQQLTAKYGAPEHFFEARKKQHDSWIWKCMLQTRPFIKQGIRWKVGNGRNINFWTDTWCSNTPLASTLGLDWESLPDAELRVSDFITPEKQWDTAKLQQYLPADLIQQIHSIPLPCSNVTDSFCWGFTGSGEFSVKSATWKAHEGLAHNPPPWKFKWIWKLDVMPKIRIFMWQICHNALPVKGTLFRRGLQIEPLCPLCLAEIEDIDHLFGHCTIANQVWSMAVAHQWLPAQPFIQPAIGICDALHMMAQTKFPWLSRVILLLWSLWKSRNAYVFRNEVPSPMGILLRAKRNWAEWKVRNSTALPSHFTLSTPHSTAHHHIQQTQFIGWQLPPGDFIKLNFDGTRSTAGAAAGFVIRSWQGSFITAGTRFLESAPILVAEATALRDGLRTALRRGYRKIEVEGDNMIVIQAVRKQILPPWQIQTIIADIWNLITDCEQVRISHIYREGNMAADWMAKYGCVLKTLTLSVFYYSPSRDFLHILVDDNLGRTLARRAV